jgi:hypothetical protein
MARHFTALGEQIDMAALAAKNAKTPALGNAKMNARGDILGNNGVVLKTQEQIEAEWKRNREAREASVGISPDLKQPLPPGAMVRGKKLAQDQDFDPDNAIDIADLDIRPTQSQRRRKIVDSDK